MQAQPWAPQPAPVEARVAKCAEPPTDQLGSAQRARVETAAGTGSGIATVNSNSEVGDGEGVLVPDSENLVSPAPRRTFSRTGRGIRETDEQAQERSPVHTPNPSVDHERPMFTPGDRVTAAQAAEFLRGVDTHTKIAWMAAVELTVNFFLTVDALVVDSNDDLSFNEIEEFASNECCDSDQMFFIQLSEETSRKIAQTPEPTTRKQIADVLSKKDVEATLLKEAMMDEVIWMVANSSIRLKICMK